MSETAIIKVAQLLHDTVVTKALIDNLTGLAAFVAFFATVTFCFMHGMSKSSKD